MGSFSEDEEEKKSGERSKKQLFEVRKLTYRLPEIPKNYGYIKKAEFVRDLFNSTIIDEAFGFLSVDEEKLKVDHEG